MYFSHPLITPASTAKHGLLPIISFLYFSSCISKSSIDETNFEITDGNKTINIIFDGFIPELFQDEMGVILDGYFENNIFYSDDMLVKHDNEYISEDGETYDVENYSK